MIDTGIIITGIIGIISTIVASFCTWFFSRKKYNAEVNSQDISNMKESLDFYNKLVDSNKNILSDILSRSEELTTLNINLMEEVQTLKKQIGVLIQIINNELGDIDLSKYGIQIENGIIIRKEISQD